VAVLLANLTESGLRECQRDAFHTAISAPLRLGGEGFIFGLRLGGFRNEAPRLVFSSSVRETVGHRSMNFRPTLFEINVAILILVGLIVVANFTESRPLALFIAIVLLVVRVVRGRWGPHR